MKLNEFITDVLKDIDNGLQEAKKITGRKYRVDTRENKGVTFDIAVTAENSSLTEAEGEAKAGFIQVLGARVGAKLENKQENSEVSRIQFTISVPSQTEQEEQEEIHRLNAIHEENIHKARSALDPYY
jgi:hypothetical protein